MRCACFVLAVLWAALLPAEDWPRFRGPNGSGVSESTDLPAEFGPGKNLAWKTPVPFGRSSPIIVGGRVFLTASQGEKLLTLSVDAKTGRVQWRREIVRARAAQIYKQNDPASPTPAADGGNVYAFFADLGLVSYGPDGNERWRLPLEPFDSFYGAGGSPIVAGATVLLPFDQRRKPFLLAVDAPTGRVRWKVERPESLEAFSTPVVFTPQQGPAQVIVAGTGSLGGYAVETGERLWWTRGVGYLPKSVPVLGSGLVFASAPGSDQPMGPPFAESLQKYDANGDGKIGRDEARNDPLFSEHFGFADPDGDGFIDEKEYNFLRMAGVGEHGLVAIRLDGRGELGTSHVRWRYLKTFPNIPAPLFYRDVLYTVKDGGIITSLDPATGQVFKTGRSPEALGEYFSSPVAADDKVYAINEAGKVTVLKAGREWEILAVNDLGEDCYATPAIADGRIYIRTREALYCFAKPPAR